MQKIIFSCLITLCFSSAAQAQVSINNAWVRATVPQQKVTGAFLQINSAHDATLIAVRSPAAAIVALHKMEMVDNVMKMRAIPGLDLPAGTNVELKPGGYHIMFFKLKEQVKEGDIIPITLVIEGKNKKRETIEVQAIAKPLQQTGKPAMQPGHHAH